MVQQLLLPSIRLLVILRHLPCWSKPIWNFRGGLLKLTIFLPRFILGRVDEWVTDILCEVQISHGLGGQIQMVYLSRRMVEIVYRFLCTLFWSWFFVCFSDVLEYQFGPCFLPPFIECMVQFLLISFLLWLDFIINLENGLVDLLLNPLLIMSCLRCVLGRVKCGMIMLDPCTDMGGRGWGLHHHRSILVIVDLVKAVGVLLWITLLLSVSIL